MRINPLWRILLCILLAVQVNAMAFAQTSMSMMMHDGKPATQEHVHDHCHEHGQADSSDGQHRSMSHPSNGPRHSNTQPDCCKSSHCQCHCVQSSALLTTPTSLPIDTFHQPAIIDLTTLHAFTLVSDPLRPPISSLL